MGRLRPFVVNDLIRGADPVKLYKCVALGRPAISIYYPELDLFAGLIRFYQSEEEFVELLAALRDRPGDLVPIAAASPAFLAPSTWRSRALVIRDVLRSALGGDGTAAQP